MENLIHVVDPLQITSTKTVHAFKIISVRQVELSSHANIEVHLYDESNSVIDIKTLVMDGTDYANWGTDDNNVVTFVANSLGFYLASVLSMNLHIRN